MSWILTGYDSAVCEWVYQKTGGFYVPGCVGIGLVRDGDLVGPNRPRLVAAVAYDGYNGAQILMHARVDDPHAVTRELIWMVFSYPFEQLGVRRITGLVEKSNKSSRKLAERLGFKLEASLKTAHPTGDLLVYRMFRDECKFLAWKSNHGKAPENIYKMRVAVNA